MPAIHSPSRIDLTEQIYRTLVRRRVDSAPLALLAASLHATVDELRDAVAVAPWLGVCTGAVPVVYCMPPQPVAAGFEVLHRGGRPLLRLPGSPGHRLRGALWIDGQDVGPVPRGERDTVLGAGELAHLICRLTSMARGWLPARTDPTRMLFELIAEAWRQGVSERLGCGAHAHRAGFTRCIAVDTNRLELVTNSRRRVHRLVNLYPVPLRGVGE